jgi:hypothetical protein
LHLSKLAQSVQLDTQALQTLQTPVFAFKYYPSTQLWQNVSELQFLQGATQLSHEALSFGR